MPNRILRDWTDSEIVDMLGVDAERFFVRLIMKVDDYGRFSANARLLKSTLFPLKTEIQDSDIVQWLSECKKLALIITYNVANKEYLQIQNFKQVLRQKKEKYPAPQTNSTCIADDNQAASICFLETKRNETETNLKTNLKFRLRQKDFFIPVSEFFKENFTSLLEMWQIRHKTFDFQSFFEKMDAQYHLTDFTNENHIRNAFRSNFEKMTENKHQFQGKSKTEQLLQDADELKNHFANESTDSTNE